MRKICYFAGMHEGGRRDMTITGGEASLPTLKDVRDQGLKKETIIRS